MNWLCAAIFAVATALQIAASLGWFMAVEEPRHYHLIAAYAAALWFVISRRWA
jgi:hypothetical protein